MIVLIVGGAKSGKSMFAQNLAKSLENKDVGLHYVATMNPYDLEDLKRIENHIKEREGYGFNTIEETINMNNVVRLINNNDIVLFDSITSLVTNSMFKGKDFVKNVSSEILLELKSLINKAGSIVIVSDYLFSDSISYDCYTEGFRKELGVINRELAKIADVVVECSYGNVIYHKGKSM